FGMTRQSDYSFAANAPASIADHIYQRPRRQQRILFRKSLRGFQALGFIFVLQVGGERSFLFEARSYIFNRYYHAGDLVSFLQWGDSYQLLHLIEVRGGRLRGTRYQVMMKRRRQYLNQSICQNGFKPPEQTSRFKTWNQFNKGLTARIAFSNTGYPRQ